MGWLCKGKPIGPRAPSGADARGKGPGGPGRRPAAGGRTSLLGDPRCGVPAGPPGDAPRPGPGRAGPSAGPAQDHPQRGRQHPPPSDRDAPSHPPPARAVPGEAPGPEVRGRGRRPLPPADPPGGGADPYAPPGRTAQPRLIGGPRGERGARAPVLRTSREPPPRGGPGSPSRTGGGPLPEGPTDAGPIGPDGGGSGVPERREV